MFRILLAILAFGVGIYSLYSSYVFEKNAVKSKGSVVGYHIEGDKTKPIIEYKVNRRQMMRLDLNLLLFSPEFEIGQKISVMYDPDNPLDAKISHFFDSWKFGFFAVFLGMVFMPGSWSSDDDGFYIDCD